MGDHPQLWGRNETDPHTNPHLRRSGDAWRVLKRRIVTTVIVLAVLAGVLLAAAQWG
jgi:hypothetical protein